MLTIKVEAKKEHEKKLELESYHGIQSTNIIGNESKSNFNLKLDEIKLEIKEDSLNVTPQQLSIVDKENNDFIIGFKAENSALKDELKRARNLFDTEKEAFSQIELALVRKLNQSEILTAKLEVEKIIAIEDLELQLLDFAVQYQEQADVYSSKLNVQELCLIAEHSQEMEALSHNFQLILKEERQKFDEIEIKLDNTLEKLLKAEQSIKKNLEYAEHDPTVLGHLLAETKIEYALQKSENEELQQKYRKLEQITVAYKLKIAVMEEEKDDMIAMKKHVEDLISDSPSKIIRK